MGDVRAFTMLRVLDCGTWSMFGHDGAQLTPADVIELGRLMQAADGGTDG